MSNPLAAYEQPIDQDFVSAIAFAESAPDTSNCATCAALDLSLCPATAKKADADVDRSRGEIGAVSVHTSPARRTIRHSTELSDFVSIICSGWAMSSAALPDGRRQILSFLLPGDMISTGSLFAPASGNLVETITEVAYRNYRRSDLKTVLFGNLRAFDIFTKTCLEEKRRADQLAVDLGRRTADERIARLILYLMDRLTRRSMARDQTIEFPLRQHHIADATGLTPVHVSKVLSKLRHSRLIEISDRSLTILDPAELNRVANMI